MGIIWTYPLEKSDFFAQKKLDCEMQSSNEFGMIFSFLSPQTILFNLRSVPDQAVNEFRLIQNNKKASLFPTYTGISRNLRLNEVFPDHISRLPAFPDFGTWYFPMQPDKRFSDFSFVLKHFTN